MFEESLSIEVLFLAIPLGILTFTGFMLFYFHRKRSILLQKKLKNKFLNDIENEKIRIARELHDAISPFTMPLKEFIKNKGQFNEENEKRWLEQIQLFETYLSHINETIFPNELLEGDLFEALQKLRYRLYTHEKKIEIHSDVSGIVPKFSSIHVFRIIQESLVNAIKYSGSGFFNIVNTQKENDLIVFLSYEAMKQNSNTQKNPISRGHKIIRQRLEILSGRHEVMIEGDTKIEKFTFKELFQ